MLQKSKKFRDRGRNRQSRQTRRMLFEPLEDRRLMTADLGGNTLAAPTSLGTLQGTRVISDFVGAADVNDYFRVGIGRQSELRLNLDGLRADADLQLLDSAGRTIASSTRGGSQPESISRTLNAGTYFVRVYQYSGDTNYLLTLLAAPDAPPDFAGNSLSAARNVGALSGTVVFNDFVGQADTADYYRFRIDARSEFQLRLDNMTADADVVLLDSAGRQLTGSYRGGAAAEAIDRVLDSGDYFVHIYPFGGANTDYRLTLTRAAVSNEGWASETGFRAADTSVQRAVVQLATSQLGQASAASRLAHSGGAWYTDVAGGDGQRIRAAFSVYDAWRSQNPTASLPNTTRQAMHDRLSETYTNANTRTELINRIIAVYEARRSSGHQNLVPQDDQQVLDFLGIRQQCVEWANASVALPAGGSYRGYNHEAVSDPTQVRPGMGLSSSGHFMVITDVYWNAAGQPVRMRVAESNWGIGWSNPIGQRPWERTVGSREIDVAGLIGSTYRVLSFE